MDNATWCRTPAAASAAKRLRPEVSKNSSAALSSNEGELARSITACVPAMASLRPSPVMLLTPVWGDAATTSWPRWRRMGTVFEPIRPVPPMTTIFIPSLLVRSPSPGEAQWPVPRLCAGDGLLAKASHVRCRGRHLVVAAYLGYGRPRWVRRGP